MEQKLKCNTPKLLVDNESSPKGKIHGFSILHLKIRKNSCHNELH